MPTPPPADDYDAQVLARFEGDRDMLYEIVQLFLEDCPPMLEAVRAAVAARDGPALQRAAHTLKGSASNFLPPDDLETGADPAGRAAAAALVLERMGAGNRLEQSDQALAALETELAHLLRRLEQLVTPR